MANIRLEIELPADDMARLLAMLPQNRFVVSIRQATQKAIGNGAVTAAVTAPHLRRTKTGRLGRNVARTAVLNFLDQHGPADVEEVCANTQVGYNTVHSMMSRLQSKRSVKRNEDGKWMLP